MRRYGRESADLVIPGTDAGLKLTLAPVGETATATATTTTTAECTVAIAGLYWFSDDSGDYTETAEAAYLLPIDTTNSPPDPTAAGPMLAMAKLVGETCDGAVTWTTSWTHENEPGGSPSAGEPGVKEDGQYLIVYPLSDTETGELSVSAILDGIEYGPILLSVLRYECATTCTPSITDLIWTQWDDEEGVYLQYDGHRLRLEYVEFESFNATAELIGVFCPDCSIEWTIDDSQVTLLSATYSANSPIISVQLDATDYGYLTIEAVVTCGSTTFPSEGVFTIDIFIVEPA